MTPVSCTILITGATGAIGSALALQYAAAGHCLLLGGRSAEKLEQLAESCREQGARVVTLICDLQDHRDYLEQVEQLCEQHCPDLVIANAGVSSTADASGECWQASEEVVCVNLLATLTTVQAVVPTMRRNGGGQIALISSLAAWYGLPVTPAYSASKAAIKNYGEALRISLASEGISVSVVMPGFVSSAMSRTVPGPKPFLMTADRAAQLII
ncbi:MAG: SDR family NAD(P)-dependent oxidoreductase, partial [Trichlorobacter sp.]|uniref:SDR family NAD(P)-dependent oxidoreductase n=1 Tax=Trichlorobacter sp. TaxID=2911007 RepID=UPI00255E904D